jgi:hypothetical protein
MQSEKIISKKDRDFLMQIETRTRELLSKRTSLDTKEQADLNAVIEKEFGRASLSNEERGMVELHDWHHNPPADYFAYYSNECRVGDSITTFMGDVIGTVVSNGPIHSKKTYSAKRSVTIRGTNGLIYDGLAEMWNGTYVRMRASKACHILVGLPSKVYRDAQGVAK